MYLRQVLNGFETLFFGIEGYVNSETENAGKTDGRCPANLMKKTLLDFTNYILFSYNILILSSMLVLLIQHSIFRPILYLVFKVLVKV